MASWQNAFSRINQPFLEENRQEERQDSYSAAPGPQSVGGVVNRFVNYRNARKNKSDEDTGDAGADYKNHFIIRMAQALHAYGTSAPRVEHIITELSKKLHVQLQIAVRPSSLMLCFKDPDGGMNQQVHMIAASSGLNIDKLTKIDDIIDTVCSEADLYTAYPRLLKVCKEAEYSIWQKLAAYVVMTFTASLIFFKVGLLSAVCSSFLCFVAALIYLYGKLDHTVAQVVYFVASVVVGLCAGIVAWVLSKIIPDAEVCYFSLCLSSIIWLLPGFPITVGVSEMVAHHYSSGSAKLSAAVLNSFQIGFGLSVGLLLITWSPLDENTPCPHVEINFFLSLFCFVLFSCAANVYVGAGVKEWPLMIVSAFVAYIVRDISSKYMDNHIAVILAAFGVGVAGAVLAFVSDGFALGMKIAGIKCLVPGGLGVVGVAKVMGADVLNGVAFVFEMMIVGLSITMGLLLAQIVLPERMLEKAEEIGGMMGFTRDIEDEEEEVLGDGEHEHHEHDTEGAAAL